MGAALVSLLTRTAFMRHADPSGVYQPCRVGMMLECSTVELLAKIASVHHGDKGHTVTALKRYAAPKVGVRVVQGWGTQWVVLGEGLIIGLWVGQGILDLRIKDRQRAGCGGFLEESSGGTSLYIHSWCM